MEHDVVIAGAGPAGSTAAAALARRGVDVLLLDRRPFPRDKACGDGIPPGSVELLDGIGAGDAVRAAGFYPIRGIRLGSPGGRTWETDFRPRRPAGEFYIAPRERFDALLQAHAVACGAHFQVATVRRVDRALDGGRIVRARIDGALRTIRARMVIGADGATSVVRQALCGRRPGTRARGVAVRAYVDGIETLPHMVEFYFWKRYLPGYAWVFPLGEGRANVGVIRRADRYADDAKATKRGLHDVLGDFLTASPIAGRLAAGARVADAASWAVPFAVPPLGPRSFDNALLVGDAAWFVDALTGEGIHNALLSATIAADVVAAALARGDASAAGLADYDRRCRAAMGGGIERAWRWQERIDRFPLWLETLFVLANAGRPILRRWLNRRSTDFVFVPRASNTHGDSG